MIIAAVPAYLGTDFRQASPGLRFGMLLRLWEGAAWSKSKELPLNDVKCLNDNDRSTMQALLARQRVVFAARTDTATDTGLAIEARAIAPFTTGLGNEHPLENGFAFLNPYGLPYLPGSGVKGVLRQAARELASGAWGAAHGWCQAPRYPLLAEDKPVLDASGQAVLLSPLDVLFGRETADGDSDHVRGVLSFWDVIPQIQGDQLLVEIMTPHQGHYYQQKSAKNSVGPLTPHDSGQPTPIHFLSVPPGSGFTFFVQCEHRRLQTLAADLVTADATGTVAWQALLGAAFTHAFDWLGFGAKTAVGYGAMGEDPAAMAQKHRMAREIAEQAQRQQREAQRERELAEMTPSARAIALCLAARKDPNQTEISALLQALNSGQWDGELKVAIATELRARMQAAKRWKEKTEKKKPEKDFDYQDTLKVMAWLQGR